jgi:hypothetical protein
MGYIFELAAEFGDNKANALKFMHDFEGHMGQLSDGRKVICSLNLNDVWKSPENSWWCRIVPEGFSRIYGPTEMVSDCLMIELTKLIYLKLKSRQGFRIAQVGWEVAESVEMEDLRKWQKIGGGIPNGTVISQDVWKEIGAPPDFSPYTETSLWKPLVDSDFDRIVKLWND